MYIHFQMCTSKKNGFPQEHLHQGTPAGERESRKSGSGADDIRRPTWPYFEAMSFLRAVVTIATPTTTNMELVHEVKINGDVIVTTLLTFSKIMETKLILFHWLYKYKNGTGEIRNEMLYYYIETLHSAAEIWSPVANATYLSNGRPKVLPCMVRFATNEFFVLGIKAGRQLHKARRWYHIHGLAQDCSISIANALETLQFWTKPSICLFVLVPEWKRGFRLAHFDRYFYLFDGLTRLLIVLIDGPPRTEMDHPTGNHGWSVGRTRILLFRSTALY